MKLKLDFRSVVDHDQYVKEYINKNPLKFLPMIKNLKKERRKVLLNSGRRTRENWSEYELNMLIDCWPFKKLEWIARTLQRSNEVVMAKVMELRKKGLNLPMKVHRNGKIKED